MTFTNSPSNYKACMNILVIMSKCSSHHDIALSPSWAVGWTIADSFHIAIVIMIPGTSKPNSVSNVPVHPFVFPRLPAAALFVSIYVPIGRGSNYYSMQLLLASRILLLII